MSSKDLSLAAKEPRLDHSAGPNSPESEGEKTFDDQAGDRHDAVGHYASTDVQEVSAKAKASDYFSFLASGFALVSDGYQNNLATVFNPIFKILDKSYYTSAVSTRVSNALLIRGTCPLGASARGLPM
ncbi:hypothetical protein IAU59_004162 [Kwoniella sp. CBS 9459]